MRDNIDNATITKWWKGVLARDERGHERGETYRDAYMRRLRCVFCDRDLQDDLRASLKPNAKRRTAMVAYWKDDDDWIFASGLYCVGRERGCLVPAEKIGALGDMHAEYFGGPRNAIAGLAERVLDFDKWEATALRRMVIVFAALSMLPASKKREPHL